MDSTKGAYSRLVAPIACDFLVVLALHQYNEYYSEMPELNTLRLVTLWIGVIMSWIAYFLMGRKCECLWEKVINTDVLYRHRVLLAHFPLIIVSAIV